MYCPSPSPAGDPLQGRDMFNFLSPNSSLKREYELTLTTSLLYAWHGNAGTPPLLGQEAYATQVLGTENLLMHLLVWLFALSLVGIPWAHFFHTVVIRADSCGPGKRIWEMEKWTLLIFCLTLDVKVF